MPTNPPLVASYNLQEEALGYYVPTRLQSRNWPPHFGVLPLTPFENFHVSLTLSFPEDFMADEQDEW